MDETLANTPDNSEKVRQAADELRSAASEKTQQFKQNAVNKAQQFREFAGTKTTDMKNTARVTAKQLKDVANGQMQTSKERAKKIHTETEDYIRQNPTKSVITALGVGFLVGLIIRK